jgi:hypothetical protein
MTAQRSDAQGGLRGPQPEQDSTPARPAINDIALIRDVIRTP